MTAATANVELDRLVDQELREFPVLAGVTIYKSAFVGLTPSGHLKPHVPGDNLVGIAYEECDASSDSTDGTSSCRVYVETDFVYTLTSVSDLDSGKPVYATDDSTIALTGHPDSFVGFILHKYATNKAVIRLKRPGELPPNGMGSIIELLTGHEALEPTGAVAGDGWLGAFEYETILGPGFVNNDAEDGGFELEFDATAEIALSSIRTPNDIYPVDKGITFEADVCVTDKGDAAAVDFDFGLGTALTTNSEANIDHADMVQLAAFHMDGNSDNINCQSDDNTTDVAALDSTVDNDSTTDVSKHWKIIVRPSGSVEFWIDGVRVLSSTTFAVLSTASLAAFVNVEKTSDDTTYRVLVKNIRLAAGAANY